MQTDENPTRLATDPLVRQKLWWRRILQVAVILAVGFFAMAPALNGGWLWDDDQQVTANLNLRSLEGLWRIWFAPWESDYYPVKSTIAWGLWQLCGPMPMGYRLFNLVCHVAGALLVWRLLSRLGSKWGWFGGLLFVAHPLTVESVTWISQIKNTVSLPFLLAAMLLYIDYDETRQKRRLAAAVLFFLAAMLSKSSVVMLPPVLVVYCWWKRNAISWRDIRSVIPFGVISLTLGCVTIWFQNTRSIGDYPIPELGWSARLAGAGTNAWFYLEKFLIPTDLSPIYPHWAIDPPTLWQALSLPAFAVLLWWFWRKRYGWGRHALLGVGFFLLNLLPVLGLQPMAFMAFTWVSDHFVYLPMIGLIGLVVAGAEAAYRRLSPPWKSVEIVSLGALAAVLVALSHWHAAVFRDGETLWTRATQRYPGSSPALNSLAVAYLEQNRVPEAFAQVHQALTIRPDYPEARNTLGLALSKAGRPKEALVEFREALRLKPRLAAAHVNASSVLLNQGRLDQQRISEAFTHLEEALKLRPANPLARNNLGLALMKAGRNEDAIAQFREALHLDPRMVESHCNLGNILLQQGQFVEAEAHFRKAIAVDPQAAPAYNSLGIALSMSGQTDEAISAFQSAIAINPSYAMAKTNLGILLSGKGAAPEPPDAPGSKPADSDPQP